MTTDRFKKMFAYHYWANDNLWRCILELSEEQFTQPCDYSIGSIHKQILHMMSVEELWLARIRDGDQSWNPATPDDYPTREAIAPHWAKIKQDWFDYLDTLTEADLDDDIPLHHITYNKTFYNPRWENFMHILNHGTDHRAQILSQIHQLGGRTHAQDFIYFTWEQ